MNGKERLVSIALSALAVPLLLVLGALITVVFAFALVWHEPRIPVGAALVLLAAAAIALVAGGKDLADGLAAWACSILAVGAILMLAKYVFEGPGDVEDIEDRH